MKFSLVMATLDRKDEIVIFIKSLLNQSYTNFELIIVDQNKDNRVFDIYNAYKNIINIIYIKSNQKGLSLNRNIGLKRCSGDIIAFPDDDCEYNNDTLNNVFNFFSHNNTYGFYTSNTREKDGNKGILNAKNTDSEITINNIMYTGISFTIFTRKECIKDFKFDEQLGVGARFGSGEESDLLFFLLKNNNKGYYHANSYIFHPAKTETIKKCYSYGKGYGALYKKAIWVYKFNELIIPFFYNIILKELIKVCIYPYEKGRFTSLKGRLYGFVFYKKPCHGVHNWK
ncbi:glycosyl transferase [Spirochaetia bacterium]|nr:glycosyl transferase [Spirochaetia bacterium]